MTRRLDGSRPTGHFAAMERRVHRLEDRLANTQAANVLLLVALILALVIR